MSQLFNSCKKWNCDFTVTSNYNFAKSQWESNGRKLEKIVWKSSSYPRLNDVLTVCGIWSTTYPFTVNNRLRYCLSRGGVTFYTNCAYVKVDTTQYKALWNLLPTGQITLPINTWISFWSTSTATLHLDTTFVTRMKYLRKNWSLAPLKKLITIAII